MPTASAQRTTMSTPSASRGWEADLHLHRIEDGLNTAPPRSLFCVSGGLRSEICLRYSSKRDSCSGVPG